MSDTRRDTRSFIRGKRRVSPSQNEDCLLATTLNFSIVLNFNKPERCRAQQTIATSRIHSNESLPTLPIDLHSINSSLSLRRNKYLASVASHVRRQVGWRLIYSTRAASYQLPTPPLSSFSPQPRGNIYISIFDVNYWQLVEGSKVVWQQATTVCDRHIFIASNRQGVDPVVSAFLHTQGSCDRRRTIVFRVNGQWGIAPYRCRLAPSGVR